MGRAVGRAVFARRQENLRKLQKKLSMMVSETERGRLMGSDRNFHHTQPDGGPVNRR
jgi:hypothetical protein